MCLLGESEFGIDTSFGLNENKFIFIFEFEMLVEIVFEHVSYSLSIFILDKEFRIFVTIGKNVTYCNRVVILFLRFLYFF